MRPLQNAQDWSKSYRGSTHLSRGMRRFLPLNTEVSQLFDFDHGKRKKKVCWDCLGWGQLSPQTYYIKGWQCGLTNMIMKNAYARCLCSSTATWPLVANRTRWNCLSTRSHSPLSSVARNFFSMAGTPIMKLEKGWPLKVLGLTSRPQFFLSTWHLYHRWSTTNTRRKNSRQTQFYNSERVGVFSPLISMNMWRNIKKVWSFMLWGFRLVLCTRYEAFVSLLLCRCLFWRRFPHTVSVT